MDSEKKENPEIDYKTLYEQLSDENVNLRMKVFKLENVRETFSDFKNKASQVFNNPMKLYSYCYLAITVTLILTSLVSMLRRNND